MRSKPIKVQKYKMGDKRTIRKFLLLPRRLPIAESSDIYIRRWLEVAAIKQGICIEPDEFGAATLEWFDISWDDLQ